MIQCMGERYIACGKRDMSYELTGTPGNALGAYMDGATVVLHGNAQDATGDTMNDGEIIIYGNTGDAAGYAMRGGKILVRDNAGYRAGIHMKAYHEKVPVLVIGKGAGSFLGEYQAGGVIIVLGLGMEDGCPVGNFCGTGMHGGSIYLRTKHLPADLPEQVLAEPANAEDMEKIAPLIQEYGERFSVEQSRIDEVPFYVLRANTANPYKRMYVQA